MAFTTPNKFGHEFVLTQDVFKGSIGGFKLLHYLDLSYSKTFTLFKSNECVLYPNIK